MLCKLVALLLNYAWGLGTVTTSIRKDMYACRMSVNAEDYSSSFPGGKNEGEEEFSLPSDAVKVYGDKQRMTRQWNDELERWKRLGIEARRDRRREKRNEQLALKAQRLAQKYVMAHDDDGSDVVPKAQLERATAFFLRLLEHLFEMEQVAHQRAKQRAIQREIDVLSGNATEIEVYLVELGAIREYERGKRRALQEMIFELPESWDHLDDETLLTLLRIRGNAKRVSKLRKRDAIEQRLRESFSKPLF